MNTDIFGITLGRLRNAEGISINKLAKELGESETVITNIEDGYMRASDEFVNKAADYFGVSMEYLLGQIDGIKAIYLSDFFEETLIFKESDIASGVLREERAIDKIKVSLESSSDRRIAMKVESNDMKNSRIEEGDIAVIKLQSTAKDGDVVVVRTSSGAILIRRYARQGNKIRLFADPVGAKIPEVTYDVSDTEYKIIGKIVTCAINL